MFNGLHKPHGPLIRLHVTINSLPVRLSLICARSKPIAQTSDNYVLTTIKMLVQVNNKDYNFQAQTSKLT